MAQPLPQFTPVADVGDGQQDPALAPGGLADRRDGDLGPQRPAVGVLEPPGAPEPGAVAVEYLRVRPPGAAVRADTDEVGRGLSGQGREAGAEQCAQSVVRPDDPAVVVDDGHREGGSGERGAVVAQLGGVGLIRSASGDHSA